MSYRYGTSILIVFSFVGRDFFSKNFRDSFDILFRMCISGNRDFTSEFFFFVTSCASILFFDRVACADFWLGCSCTDSTNTKILGLPKFYVTAERVLFSSNHYIEFYHNIEFYPFFFFFPVRTFSVS